MLKISEKFKIECEDAYNLTLYELRSVKGKDKKARVEWCRAGYFGKLSHALSCALNRYAMEIIAQEDLSLRELLTRLENIEIELKNIPVINGTEVNDEICKAE